MEDIKKEIKTEIKTEAKNDLGILEIFEEKFNHLTKETEKINFVKIKPLRIQKHSKTKTNQYGEMITSSFKIFFQGQVNFSGNYKIKYQDKIYSVIDCYNVLNIENSANHTEIEI